MNKERKEYTHNYNPNGLLKTSYLMSGLAHLSCAKH